MKPNQASFVTVTKNSRPIRGELPYQVRKDHFVADRHPELYRSRRRPCLSLQQQTASFGVNVRTVGPVPASKSPIPSTNLSRKDRSEDLSGMYSPKGTR